MAYDVECLESKLLSIIQTNMPAKLLEITTEKADGIILPVIPSTDYYNSITNQIINVDPYIHYGTYTISVDNQNIVSNTARTYEIFFEVIFINKYDSIDVRKKCFRYIRALYEIIDEHFRELHTTSKPVIIELLPTDFRINDDQSTYYKMGGIAIRTTIA